MARTRSETPAGTRPLARFGPPAVLIGVPLLLVARLAAGGFNFDTVWAEDGRVFLLDAREHGLASLVYTYAGYLHVPPRLLALVGAQLPLEAYAIWCVAASILVVTGLSYFVFRVGSLLFGSTGYGLVLAFGMALVPAAGRESIGSLANLQWWFLPAAFVTLVAAPLAGRRLRVAGAAVCLLSALATPLTLFMLPGAVALRRDGWRSLAVAGVLVGLAVQAVAMVSAPESNLELLRDTAIRPRDAAHFVVGVLGSAQPPYAVAAVLGGLMLAALVWIVRRAGMDRLAAVAFGSALVLFVFTSISSGSGSRYQMTVALLLLVGALSLVRQLDHVPPAIYAVVGLTVVLGFAVPEARVSGASWSDAVHRFEEQCQSSQSATVEVAPEGWRADTVQLSCRS